jgi:phospholipid-translocating ATPase
MRGGNRKLHLSKIYSFTCFKASSVDGDHLQIGGKGYSRVVFCNEQDSPAATSTTTEEAVIRNFADNSVRSTKYTAATFLPKSLFEQFRRVANFYFLVTGVLAFTQLAPYRTVTAILPLVVVIGASGMRLMNVFARINKSIQSLLAIKVVFPRLQLDPKYACCISRLLHG